MAHPRDFVAAAMRPRLPRPAIAIALRWVERQIGQRFESFAAINTIRNVHVPVLIMHGAQDTVVPVTEASRLHQHADSHARLVVMPDADHHSVDAIGKALPEVAAWRQDVGVAVSATAATMADSPAGSPR